MIYSVDWLVYTTRDCAWPRDAPTTLQIPSSPGILSIFLCLACSQVLGDLPHRPVQGKSLSGASRHTNTRHREALPDLDTIHEAKWLTPCPYILSARLPAM